MPEYIMKNLDLWALVQGIVLLGASVAILVFRQRFTAMQVAQYESMARLLKHQPWLAFGPLWLLTMLLGAGLVLQALRISSAGLSAALVIAAVAIVVLWGVLGLVDFIRHADKRSQ
jgi:hypothetical protein